MTHHLWVIMWLIFWTFHKLFCHGFFLNIFFRCFHFNNVYFRFDIKHFRFWRFWIHSRSFWFVEFFDCRWLAISFYFHCIHKGAGQSGRGWSRLGYAEKYNYVIVTSLRFRAFVSKFAEIVIFSMNKMIFWIYLSWCFRSISCIAAISIPETGEGSEDGTEAEASPSGLGFRPLEYKFIITFTRKFKNFQNLRFMPRKFW